MTNETQPNAVVEAYSENADDYDSPENLASCWGRVTRDAVDLVRVPPSARVIADVGCGTGRELLEIASRVPPEVELVGVEPAPKMREIATRRTAQLPNVRILSGQFEHLPLESSSVDYLYSILAFHWATDVDVAVAELKRVLAGDAAMDLYFIGRQNGREFIERTTPVFFKYLPPAAMVKAAQLRTQLTLDEARAVFGRAFPARRIAVTDSFTTYYDTLDGHWGWWLRIEGQLLEIPADKRKECDEAVRRALATLETNGVIPYTVHLIHVKLG